LIAAAATYIGLVVGKLAHARVLNLGADQDWPGAQTPELVDGQVAGYRAQPRHHLAALGGKAGASSPDPPEDVLHQIFGQHPILYDAQHCLVDARRIAIVEHFQGFALAR